MINGVFGLPSAGKSLFLAYCADRALKGKSISVGGYSLQHFRKYDKVYTNFPFIGTYKLDFERLGYDDYNHCLILVDEIMLLCDSRNFRSFGENLKFFFSQHRKMHVDFIYCSQSYDDVDKKIRGLTQQYFYIKRILPHFATIIPITAFFDVSGGQIKQGFEFAPVLVWEFLWLPKLYKLVDSYALINKPAELQPVNLQLWDI